LPPASRAKISTSGAFGHQPPNRTGSAKSVSCVSAAPAAATRCSCVVLPARRATMSSRFCGCQPTGVAGLNSVYGATFATRSAGMGGSPSAFRLAFGGSVSAPLATSAAASVAVNSSGRMRNRNGASSS
jgi:hypothetical protein